MSPFGGDLAFRPSRQLGAEIQSDQLVIEFASAQGADRRRKQSP